MAYFDVFNGDADGIGICALQQLRLIELREATLVTGVKRDIGLLTRILANPDYEVTVLDISLGQESGRPPHFDHHFPGVTLSTTGWVPTSRPSPTKGGGSAC